MSELVLTWTIANSGTSPGSVGWNLEETGWVGFIQDKVEPAIAWCEATGVTPIILLQNAFGAYYDEDVRLNTYDFANYYGLKFLTNNFTSRSGWRSVTSRVDCYFYTGGLDLSDNLRDLPPAEQASLAKRNLKPYQQAGFKGGYIDYAENAIPSAYLTENDTGYARRSVDSPLLTLIDSLFDVATGVEAAPRAFSAFSMLWDRNCVAQDSVWRHRYGGFTSQQIIDYGYGERHASHVALGYDRSVLTGTVWRTLPYSDDAETTAELAALISGEGDVPAVSPAPLIAANILASDLV